MYLVLDVADLDLGRQMRVGAVQLVDGGRVRNKGGVRRSLALNIRVTVDGNALWLVNMVSPPPCSFSLAKRALPFFPLAIVTPRRRPPRSSDALPIIDIVSESDELLRQSIDNQSKRTNRFPRRRFPLALSDGSSNMFMRPAILFFSILCWPDFWRLLTFFLTIFLRIHTFVSL